MATAPERFGFIDVMRFTAISDPEGNSGPSVGKYKPKGDFDEKVAGAKPEHRLELAARHIKSESFIDPNGQRFRDLATQYTKFRPNRKVREFLIEAPKVDDKTFLELYDSYVALAALDAGGAVVESGRRRLGRLLRLIAVQAAAEKKELNLGAPLGLALRAFSLPTFEAPIAAAPPQSTVKQDDHDGGDTKTRPPATPKHSSSKESTAIPPPRTMGKEEADRGTAKTENGKKPKDLLPKQSTPSRAALLVARDEVLERNARAVAPLENVERVRQSSWPKRLLGIPGKKRRPPAGQSKEVGYSEETTALINSLGLASMAPDQIADELYRRANPGRKAKPEPKKRYVMVKGVAAPGYVMQFNVPGANPATIVEKGGGGRPKIRYGELLVVRKKLVAYELAKFSHIENVLAGETRLREHRHRRLSEEQVRQLTVVEREDESDLQQTEKNMLQTELARSTSTQLSAEANMTVSGSYGPSTEFSAQTAVAGAIETESSARTASTFAREVTERTTQRLRQRREEERTRREVDEQEEFNRHSFEGKDKHIRGLYRWLNEVHEAQVFNLGARYYVELIVPEPSANFMRLLADDRVVATELPAKPVPLEIGPNDERWDELWGALAVQYETSIPAPPSDKVTVGAVVHSSSTTGESYAHSEKLQIPDGYEAVSGKVKVSKSKTEDDWWVSTHLGTNYFWYEEDSSETSGTLARQRGDLTFATNARYVRQLHVAAEAKCTLTEERRNQWRADAYDAALQAYRNQYATWQNAIASAREEAEQRRQQGGEEMRRLDVEKLIREEIERAFLSILLNRDVRGFDTLQPEPVGEDANGEPYQPPSWRYNFPRVAVATPQIGFLQQAFEWRNMNIVFYPYFWGAESRWAKFLERSGGEDPMFAEFLSAGAARIQVPIRPEMTGSVLRFIETGQMSQGEDGQIPLLDELLEVSDHPDHAIAIGEPWELSLPTSLVVLEKEDAELPLRDSLRHRRPDAGADALDGDDDGRAKIPVNET